MYGSLNNSTDDRTGGVALRLERVFSGWTWWQRYLVIFVFTLVSVALRLALGIPDPPLLSFFILPVCFGACLGGLAGGCFATLVSVAGADYFLFEPLHSFQIRDPGQQADAVIFIVVGVTFSFLFDRSQRTTALSKQLEHRERALREQWEQVLLISPAAICSFRRDSQGQVSFPFSTATIKAFYPIEPDDLAIDGAPAIALVNPADIPRVQESIIRSADDLSPFHEEWRVNHPTKGEIWVECHSEPLAQADGSTIWHGLLLDITRRKRAEAVSESNRAAYATLVNQLPQMVWTCTAEGACDFLSERWVQFTGLPAEAQLRYAWLEQIHPDDRTSLLEAWRLSVAQRTDFTAMFRVRRYDGTYHWFDTRANPLFDETGKIVKWLGSNTDIQLTHDLNERLAQQALLLDLCLEPILVWSPTSGIEFWNKGCEQCYGFSATEAMGRSSHELLQTRLPEARPEFVETLLRQGSWSGELGYTTKHGERLSVLSRMQVIDYQGRKLVLESNRDITARKQTEEALRLWAETFERAEFALCITDAVTNTFKAVNATYAQERGYSVDELLGKSVFSMYPTERLRETEEFVVEVDKVGHGTFESEHLTKDGRRFPVWMDITTLNDSAGQAQLRIACAFDVTARKAAETARETALCEAERLARVRSEFLANMSHEIRTPLNAILGFAQVGVRDSNGRLIQSTFAHILTAGKHLLGVIDDILDFSKIEAGKLVVERQRFALNDMLDKAVALVASQAYAKGLDFQVHEAPGLPEFVIGDPLRTGQVLTNLLSNAVKFTMRGQVTLTVADAPGGVVFSVKDTGIGISNEAMSRLFQPFAQADGSTTRRFGGTGLGLMICKRLLDLMGGAITVTSEAGAGSSFVVSLPVAVEGRHTEPTPLEGRVVLAGLPEAEAESLRHGLTERGLEVVIATPEQAREVIADLYVLDHRLWSESALQESIDGALNRQQKLALVRTPVGDSTDLERYRDRVQLLERPLRVSRVLHALFAPAADRLPTPCQGRLRGLRLLAVEDEEVNRIVLAELLSGEGAAMVIVNSGQSALDHLRTEGLNAYDLVLMDVQMPDMDGYETTRRIHALAPALPVVGLTAHALPEARRRCLEAGMLAHLTKPVDLDALVEAIRSYLPQEKLASRPGRATVVETSAAPAVPDPETQAPIDWKALEACFANRTEFVFKLCKVFTSSHANTGTRLREAAQRHDHEALTSLAHGLKGVSANLRANAVQTLAAELETAAEAEVSGTKELAERLAGEVEEVLAAATRYLQRSDG